MKHCNKIYPVFILSAMFAFLTSCSNTEDDIFNETAPERMTEMLNHAKEVLTSSPCGWAFDYYPDENKAYGGYAFTLQFTDSEVTVGSEIKPGEFCTSLYRFTDDYGPVLTFDVYNDIMHYFAKPDSDNPQGHDGDFEFIILDITDNVIKLRGKRTHNDMYMYRLDRDPQQYLDDVIDMAHDICLPQLEGKFENMPVTATINPDIRFMTVNSGNSESQGSYFVPTDKGIRFVSPIVVNGVEFDELDYSHRDMTYTSVPGSVSSLSLTHVVGEDYILYEDIPGEYTLIYENGDSALDFELKATPEKNGFIMTGINPNYDVEVTYDRMRGCPMFHSQQIGTDAIGKFTLLVWFTCKEYDGKYSVNTGCGMYAVPDLNNKGTFIFEPNEYATVHANSFYIAQIRSLDYIDSLDGDASEKWRIDGKNELNHVVSMCRK